jgi:aminomethyltransferase
VNPSSEQKVDKRTPLYDEHLKLGAKMVSFAGWEMPIQYKGIKEEHLNVRTNVGLFDVSHMGEVFVRGPKSLATLQWLTPNDVAKLKAGEAQYSLLTNPQGGIVDDIIIYCISPEQEYMVCVNAANVEKDFKWMVANNKGADIVNSSDDWGQIAVQGPKAVELLNRVLGESFGSLKAFEFRSFQFGVEEVYAARTGYTGEDGGEIFVPRSMTAKLWQELLKQGQDLGVQPIGLGARDTLRTEMKYSLYGHEITDTTDPISSGLGWVVKLGKGDFIGQAPISKVKADGPKTKLVGLKLLDKGIPREGYGVFSAEGAPIGKVTSGTLSPSTGESIGIAAIDARHSGLGMEVFVDIRGRKAKSVVMKTPFVKTSLSKA